MAAADDLILVDEQNNPVGYCSKLAAHQDGGKLHRAFSIYIFNSRGELLLQKRAAGKYHFSGLWTNTCCSHPRRGQTTLDAAQRRLREEFGFDSDLHEVFCFTYRAADELSSLTEHEYDHVFVGRFDGEPKPDLREISQWKWMAPSALLDEIRRHSDRYTPWFKLSLERVLASI